MSAGIPARVPRLSHSRDFVSLHGAAVSGASRKR